MNVLNKVTRKTLSKNKVRTMVTVVGIMLSAAMFMAVMTSVTSVQGYMLDAVKAADGSFYAWTEVGSAEERDAILNDSDIKDGVVLQYHGYADIGSQNEYKPYLFIGGIKEGFADMASVNILEGRMAENGGEIILPKHLRDNGGVRYELGDKITVQVGRRVWEDRTLTQINGYYAEDMDEDGEKIPAETLTDLRERTYTVVGFYARPGWENYSAPGYTALTVYDEELEDSVYRVFYQTKKLKGVSAFVSGIDSKWENSKLNTEYLRANGAGFSDGINSMLYMMAAILSLLIMFGSISLIYNAFAISVSERTKQFGILKSIGATKKQMRRSVIYESLLLASFGIPLGILAGIFGMFVTFKAIGGLFDLMLSTENVRFTIHVKWQAALISAVICLITVLISANIPAKRAAKKPAIEAIKQSEDIRVKAGNVRTWGITYKLFKFEGMLASKNFKRNKKRYRATVISLFMSIVLFISASSFCGYMSRGVNAAANRYNYDIYCRYRFDLMSDKLPFEQAEKILESAKSVSETIYSIDSFHDIIKLDEELVPEESWKLIKRYTQSDEYETTARYVFIEDSKYVQYLEENGLDAERFTGTGPLAAVYCRASLYDGNKVYPVELLKKSVRTLEITESVYNDETGVSEDVAVYREVGAYMDKPPMGVDESNFSEYVNIMYPYSAVKTVMGEDCAIIDATFYMKSDNPTESYDDIISSMEDSGVTGLYVYNRADEERVTRALVTVIKVFSYGFIVLISLISLANVFNTISTNVGLRRREFAMLKSVGMTKKGFNRMMNYECLLYGVKGTVFGLPAAVFISWLMSRSMDLGVEMGFMMPWSSIVIAVASVFMVVFATMLYSMNKIKHDNTVETLRRETA
ncbi:MAG: FtsX-like permease family protein [Butyrivibrio sp.]|nr:FtsX-like permease family protein [Butyrivibrio sp.]